MSGPLETQIIAVNSSILPMHTGEIFLTAYSASYFQGQRVEPTVWFRHFSGLSDFQSKAFSMLGLK